MVGKTVTLVTSEESFMNNYGAALQGYALYQTLEELGGDVQIVRYAGGEIDKNQLRYRLFCVKRALGKVYHWIKGDRDRARNRVLNEKYHVEMAQREELFELFSHKMRLWNENRVHWQQLKKQFPCSDIYVCGSDQIWNPFFKRGYNDPGYFLAFAPKGSLKISYAPSFGCSDLPLRAQKNLGELLKDFSAISVRENSGVEIVKKYAGKTARQVLDPTMLRTPQQWKQLARLPEGLPEKYILCYRFADSAATRRAIDAAASMTGLPVVSMPLSDASLTDEYQFVFSAGPQEFVGLIEHAALVCTDSFHATVFSVLMETPVCVFLRENYSDSNSMNSRVYSLLEMLHLENLIKTDSDPDGKVLECLHVDYTQAHRLLEEERKRSLQYLRDAFNGRLQP